MTHDGPGKYISQVVEKVPGKTDDIVGILRRRIPMSSSANFPSAPKPRRVVRRAVPRGGRRAQQLHAGLHRARGYWNKRFEDKGLPIIGDDIKSQVGATITHRAHVAVP
jgi:myo-inositol-1-phosphate synthase